MMLDETNSAITRHAVHPCSSACRSGFLPRWRLLIVGNIGICFVPSTTNVSARTRRCRQAAAF